MKLRLEEERDAEVALAVERAAFGSETQPEIVRAVRNEPDSFGVGAEDDGRIVEHVQLSRAWIGADAVLALGPVGVEPERQGEGIGSALIRAALDEAGRRHERAVILLGSPDFYPRFGFEPAATHGLRNPFAGVQPDGFVIEEEDFMIARLDEETHRFAGPVTWHPSFGEPG